MIRLSGRNEDGDVVRDQFVTLIRQTDPLLKPRLKSTSEKSEKINLLKKSEES